MYSPPVIRGHNWLIADCCYSSMSDKFNGLMLIHGKESEIRYKSAGLEMQGHGRGILCILQGLGVQSVAPPAVA